MGNRLVALALLPRADLGLTHGARLVLVRMAASAKDSDPEPLYWGGWHYLAGALGHELYTGAAHQAVARAIRELRKAGMVAPVGSAKPGERVGYLLLLDLGPVDTDE